MSITLLVVAGSILTPHEGRMTGFLELDTTTGKWLENLDSLHSHSRRLFSFLIPSGYMHAGNHFKSFVL